MSARDRAHQVRYQLVIFALGSFGLLGASASHAGPALGPAEKFFDPQPAALVRAALAQDATRVRELVASGVNPNSQGPRSNNKNTPQITLLGYGIGQRSEPALKLLIEAGANPLFEPRNGDSNAFGFAVVRHDTVMLDALYRAWPMAKVPAKTQVDNAFAALEFDCNTCLQVMFQHGLPVAIQDERGYDLLMTALSREDFPTAEWLLGVVGVPLTAVSSRGATAANQLQRQLGRYLPGRPIPEGMLRLQALMQSRGIVFPVETSAQWQAARGMK